MPSHSIRIFRALALGLLLLFPAAFHSQAEIIHDERFSEKEETPADHLIASVTDTSSAPIRIIRCEVFNRKTGEITDRTVETINTKEINLFPLHAIVQLELTTLYAEDRRLTRYSYMLEGLDSTWHTSQTNIVRLKDLPYGDFVLRIKPYPPAGIETINELKIVISMFRPFFLTRWFLVLLICILIISVLSVFRWRLRRLKRAKASLEKIVSERTQEILNQKEEIESQARKLNELDIVKSRFYANISHELRTPLTLILGHLEILKNNHFEGMDENAQESLSISKQNSERLLEMVEEILDLSKLEAGQLRLSPKPVHLNAVILRFYDMFRSFAAQKQIDFSLDFQLPHDLMLVLDQNKFEKVLSNLLINAVKYTNNEGQIALEVSEWIPSDSSSDIQKSWISIRITDTGRGIHPDDLPKVFERFYQSEQPDAVAEGGTGIGLAFAKELTELMGGTLEVESVLEEGSTFTFTIPKVVVQSSLNDEAFMGAEEQEKEGDLLSEMSNADEDQDDRPQTYEETPVILIVEDHDQMRDFVRLALVPHYRIEEASNGQEALRKLKKHKVDLVISDVMMPQMDGFQLLDEIKKEGRFGDLPMIMLTARAADEDKLQALTTGVDDYLTKPFNPPELLARTNNLLRNYLERQKHEKSMGDDAEEKFMPIDEQFLQKAKALVHDEIGNSQFSVGQMADQLSVSEVQLLRKLKKLTGLTPVQFIRELRLQRARKLLENREKETISEVMYAVGFRQAGYFARNYAKRFGKKPSEYFGG